MSVLLIYFGDGWLYLYSFMCLSAGVVGVYDNWDFSPPLCTHSSCLRKGGEKSQLSYTPTRKESEKMDVHIAITKLPTEIINGKYFSKYWDKNKITKVPCLPTKNHTHMDAIIVTVTQLPKYFFKGQQTTITKTEEMNEKQSLFFNNIVQ